MLLLRSPLTFACGRLLMRAAGEVSEYSSAHSMGVPAFFKWLSTKYPKIVVDCNEERHTWSSDGKKIPVDTSKPNPNGLEYE